MFLTAHSIFGCLLLTTMKAVFNTRLRGEVGNFALAP
jgi:hypothetical protein